MHIFGFGLFSAYHLIIEIMKMKIKKMDNCADLDFLDLS